MAKCVSRKSKPSWQVTLRLPNRVKPVVEAEARKAKRAPAEFLRLVLEEHFSAAA